MADADAKMANMLLQELLREKCLVSFLFLLVLRRVCLKLRVLSISKKTSNMMSHDYLVLVYLSLNSYMLVLVHGRAKIDYSYIALNVLPERFHEHMILIHEAK